MESSLLERCKMERLQRSRPHPMQVSTISTVKQQLKSKISTSRRRKGLGDIIVNEEKKNIEMTMFDIERREKRKASNRKAARKLREKNLRKQEEFVREFQHVQEENRELKSNLALVRHQLREAEHRLMTHMLTCSVPDDSSSSGGLQLPAEYTAPLTPPSPEALTMYHDNADDISMYDDEGDDKKVLDDAAAIKSANSVIDIRPMQHANPTTAAKVKLLQHTTTTIDISALQQKSDCNYAANSNASGLMSETMDMQILKQNLVNSSALQDTQNKMNISALQDTFNMGSVAKFSDMGSCNNLNALQQKSARKCSTLQRRASKKKRNDLRKDKTVTYAINIGDINTAQQHKAPPADCSIVQPKPKFAAAAANDDSGIGAFDSIDSDTSVSLSQITPTIGVESVDVYKQNL